MTMSLRSSYYLSALLLYFHPIFRPHALVASDTPGTLKFYSDYDCSNPSTLNPTVTLRLSTYLVTTGAEGVVIAALPPYPQGTAAPIYYSDTACGVQTNNVIASIFSDSYFILATSSVSFNAKSLMFSYQPTTDKPQPSSTTTAVVSALAAVATGSTGSGGGGSGSGSGNGSSTSSAGSSSSTGTNTGKNGAGSTGSSSEGASGTGLGTGDIIALAVGLGIGVPTIVIMVLAWRYPAVRDVVTALIPGWLIQQPAFPHNQSQQWLHGRPQGLASQPSMPQQWNYNHPHELASQRTWPQQWQHDVPQEMDARQQPFRPY